MTKAALAASAAVVCLHAPASAQQKEISNPQGLVQRFDVAGVERFVTEMGGAVLGRQTLSDGGQVVNTQFGQLKVRMLPRVCDGPNNTSCRGLLIVATFRDAISAGQANAYNDSTYVTMAVSRGSQGSYTQSYVIADHGVPRGTLAVTINVFINDTISFASMMSESQTANQISYRPGAAAPGEGPRNVAPGVPMPGDDIADSLNARQKIDNTSASAGATGDARIRRHAGAGAAAGVETTTIFEATDEMLGAGFNNVFGE